MIGIVDFGSAKTVRIASVVTGLGYSCEVFDWQKSGNVNQQELTGLILSGAPVLLAQTAPDEYLSAFSFIRKCNIPVLGICFGHQLLGLLFGAVVFKGREVRENTEISISQVNGLFEGFGEKVVMMEDHTEGISLPADFTKTASSESYEVESMQHSSLPLYGVQFHPEVSGEVGVTLLNNFCKLTKSI